MLGGMSGPPVLYCLANILPLFQVHNEVGRGDFMSIYLASGVFGSLASLSAHVLGGKLGVTSLGASGAIAGVVAMWCMLHSKYVLSPCPAFIHSPLTRIRKNKCLTSHPL